MASETKTAIAWGKILEKYPGIEDSISKGEMYEISAADIKEFREPRLMTKHDTFDSVSVPLKKLNLNILPVSRSAYVLGDFLLHEKLPDLSNLKPKSYKLPRFETLAINSISSESNAINALLASDILKDFLGCENIVETFNGRMGSGNFDFNVNRKNGGQFSVSVHGAQLEIDGGFENDESIVIMEAKNVLNDDFHVRQLYFPYRRYKSFVKKPIRLLFSQYTNYTYYIHEYCFRNLFDYSSLELLRSQAYTFDDDSISMEDIHSIWKKVTVQKDDNMNSSSVPFIQADRFDRLIALLEKISGIIEKSMTTDEIADFMGTVLRQASYYSAAGEYLGLLTRDKGRSALTAKAEKILSLGKKERQLSFVELMFEHKIFHQLFGLMIQNGSLPDITTVQGLMCDLNVCSSEGSTLKRRAKTVMSWLGWIQSLVDE